MSSDLQGSNMVRFAVGEPHPTLRPPVPEGLEFLVTTAGPELRMAFRDPTPNEVAGVQKGELRLELLYLEDLIWLLVRFRPGLEWSEAPFTQWLVPDDRRAAPQAIETGDERYVFSVTLLDSATGVVRALRTSTLSPESSWRLRDYYSRQAQTPPIDLSGYTERVQRVQSRSSTEQLVKMAVRERET